MPKEKGKDSGSSGDAKPRLIDSQNRVALTNEAMNALGVKSGDYVALEVEGRSVRIHKVKWTLEKQ